MEEIKKIGEIKDKFFNQCDDMFDQEFQEQGKQALIEVGLTEDEAERQLEDFII